jgi:AcrR family transcriptional regulator
MKVRKTQTLIIESLLGLLEKYSFSAISVAKIAQEALVARNSFYRNFNSKEDILRVYIKILIYDFSQTAGAKRALDSVSLYGMAMAFFAFFRNYQKFIMTLNTNHLISILQDEFAHYLAPLIERHPAHSGSDSGRSGKNLTYYVAYQSAGLCHVLVCWVEGECRESEPDMAKLLNRIVRL